MGANKETIIKAALLALMAGSLWAPFYAQAADNGHPPATAGQVLTDTQAAAARAKPAVAIAGRVAPNSRATARMSRSGTSVILKAQAGVRRIRERHLIPYPVLAADTTVEIDGQVIGKPAHEADAVAILQRLSGRSHRVLTAVALSGNGRTEHLVSISEVRFRTLDSGEIRRYVASGEPLDKAGAYGIQGRAAIFVEEIKGSYTGIMGLPLYETALLLRRYGYPI